MSADDDQAEHPTDRLERELVESYACWYDAWWQAWQWAETQGHCDALGSREFARVTAEARIRGVPPDQTSMRLFIRARANVAPHPSITEGSLARRERRANEKARED